MRANVVTRNVLKIKRYAQRLTQKACMGEGGSYLCAPERSNASSLFSSSESESSTSSRLWTSFDLQSFA